MGLFKVEPQKLVIDNASCQVIDGRFLGFFDLGLVLQHFVGFGAFLGFLSLQSYE